MKTEKDKMLAGVPYFPDSEDLFSERLFAKELCMQYNSLKSNDKTRIILLKDLLGNSYEDTVIEPNFFCDYGYNIFVGKKFYVNHNCVMLDCAKIKFGNNVFIGPNCGFYTAVHPMNFEDRAKGIEYAKPITIGNDVWIGGNVVILPGVTVGNNVVIGAGSVVTKSLPSNVLAVGNPCRVIKNI